MRKKDIIIGSTYVAKVSGKLATVRVVRESPYGGWDGVNVATGREIRVRSGARLRRPATVRAAKASTPASTSLPIGTRGAIYIMGDGVQKAVGVIREAETDEVGTSYRVDVTEGDQCAEHRTADGELWVCQFEVKPLPA